MMTIDKGKLLADARRDANEWLKAFSLDGKANVDIIRKELSEITFKGKPVLALVATDPDQCCDLIAEGVRQLTNSEAEAQAKLRELKPANCIWDYYLMAFYDCAYRRLPKQTNEFMKKRLLKAFKHGLGFIINLGGLIIGVTRPEAHLDETRRIHREDGPAIIWGGWRQWFWHGINVPQQWIEAKDSLTKKDFAAISNQEQKRAFCEILGWERVLNLVGAKKIHSDDWGSLVEADLDDDNGRKARFADVLCSTTDRRYLIRTHPNTKTCAEALARSAKVSVHDYKFTKES